MVSFFYSHNDVQSVFNSEFSIADVKSFLEHFNCSLQLLKETDWNWTLMNPDHFHYYQLNNKPLTEEDYAL